MLPWGKGREQVKKQWVKKQQLKAAALWLGDNSESMLVIHWEYNDIIVGAHPFSSFTAVMQCHGSHFPPTVGAMGNVHTMNGSELSVVHKLVSHWAFFLQPSWRQLGQLATPTFLGVHHTQQRSVACIDTHNTNKSLPLYQHGVIC